jgi:cellulose synthase/poly-beta-1,6-N-acetylglucosamine synthase-like glycosyltransferase
MWLTILVLIYGAVLTLLFIYGINILYLTYLALRHRQYSGSYQSLDHLPTVTVQLPIYNELYVARRVIDAACALDYPLLEIQVLDDSTDATRFVVAALVEHYQAHSIQIVHLHRTQREGFKAGALAEGLKIAQGDFIAIFDADFVPEPDFLRRVLPVFSDLEVGFVQTRWGHTNADYSLLTRVQSIAIDAHFAIEQYARAQAGFLMNFNGTAGVWRREAIETAGGWRSETLTEDLDLSYRAQFAGWKPAYLRDVVVPGEIPVTLNALRRQQYRWARGSIECAVNLLPQLWRKPYSLLTKLQGTLHLTGYAIQLLMVLVSLLYPLVLIIDHSVEPLFNLTVIFTLTFCAPSVYFLMGQREIGKSWWKAIPQVLGLNILGAGMMYHNAGAVLSALLDGKSAEFERTPKLGITEKAQTWRGNVYQLRPNWSLGFESLMLFYNLNSLRLAIKTQNWSIAFFAGLFAIGCAAVLLMSLAQFFEQQWQYHIHTRYSEQDV